ncbi:secreted RxLR effector protein 78-like [Bidens hawaiensis]|uniref:secreted RxLR effector protein 78-like n=1 Tax=Bidens hawaiensis TaxID=980011 RepID=UPI004049FD98
MANRSILDGSLVLNEVISWLRRSKKKGLIFKVDVDKSYDSLNWKFLDSILEQMNFPTLWRKWVSGILVSDWASVLVNGSPTPEFQSFLGLHQGDPLSPFLFIIAMEALSCVMRRAVDRGIFGDFIVGGRV